MIHSYIVKKLCWNYAHLHGHSKATEICHPYEHTKRPLSEILLKLLTHIGNCKSSARTTNVILIQFLLKINLTKKFLADQAQANHNNFSKKHPLSFRVA